LFGFNITDMIESVLGVNLTEIQAYIEELSSLAEFLITDVLENLDIGDIIELLLDMVDFKITDMMDSLLTDILNFNITDAIDSLLGFNLTDIGSIFGINLTSLFDGDDAGNTADNTGDKGTGFDWSKIFGGNGSIIDNIIDMIIGNDKKGDNNNGNANNNANAESKNTSPAAPDSIASSDLKTYYSKSTSFKVTVMSGGKPVTGGTVIFTIKNTKYSVNIGSNGVAVLTMKLKPGTYLVTSTYGGVSVQNKIVIKKSIITKNVSKKYKKAGKFTVKVLNSKGKPYAKQKVKIKLKGKTYTVKTNKKGIATFKLPKSLKVGKYTIKTTCNGLTVSNKLTVKK
jgi:hypothetical protein